MFTFFSELPPELREEIWHLALAGQRIIEVRLRNRVLIDGLLARQQNISPTPRPRTHENERYGVMVNGHQTISKLFRVSRDARQAALAFYRVHLPCWLIRGATKDDKMKPGMLYFNPEHDFLFLRNDTGQVPEFLRDLRTIYDPRGIGLLNLAVDQNGLLAGPGGFSCIDVSALDASLRENYLQTLAQLREVFFVQIQAVGRDVFGLWSGARTHEFRSNRSFPILPMGLNFDRLNSDPRPISQELGMVFINQEPRRMIQAWGQLYYNLFGGGMVPRTEYRVLLAYSSSGCQIYTKQDAQEWLQKESQTWTEESLHLDETGMVPKDRPEEHTVDAAFGFWLFRVDAFGQLPESPNDHLRSETPLWMNLKDHWPELGLVSLP